MIGRVPDLGQHDLGDVDHVLQACDFRRSGYGVDAAWSTIGHRVALSWLDRDDMERLDSVNRIVNSQVIS